MFIARAVCESKDYGITEYAICTDTKTEEEFSSKNTDNLFYVKFTRPIADSILKAAARDTFPTPFACTEVQYTLLKYTCNANERYFNKHRKNYVVKKEICRPSSEIYVYSQRCRCAKCYSEYGFDNIINICGLVLLENDKHINVEIDMQKCTRCNKYFIDAQSLALYEQKHGKLRINKRYITGNEIYRIDTEDSYFNVDSILSRNGYSTKLNSNERKQILINMMENGISKAEIKDKLSEFIFFRSIRCPYAASKWEEDLKFVNSYNLESEDRIRFV